MFIAYTICDNGLRFFTDLSGVCVSYDPQVLKRTIAERDGCLQRNKAHVEAMEKELREMQDKQSLPPIVTLIREHNSRALEEQVREHRRVSTAEATVNDQLVRDVMFFEDVKSAVAYTAGVSAVEETAPEKTP
jgi:hypothetical protein